MKIMTKGFIKPNNLTSTVVSLAMLVAAGCSNASPPEEIPEDKNKLEPAKTQPVESKVGGNRNTIPLSEAQKMNKKQQIVFARKDLAKRLALDLNEVNLSGMTPVTWRSGALGCPKPGMQYTQALVPGVLIMLRVDNTPYRYHAIPSGEPFYCPDSLAESPYLNSSDA